jgi:hypothetical protein
MRLYDIAREIEDAFICDEETGEILIDAAKKLDGLEIAFESKAENIAKMILGLEVEAEAFTAEAKRLQAKAKTLDARVAWLKQYLADCMQLLGRPKVKAGVFALSLRTSERIDVPNIDALPEQYRRTTTTIEPDKRLIAQDRKGGAIIPGVTTIERVGLLIR